jgi:hypothetical protein
VLRLSSHLLLHRLSRCRQGIHTMPRSGPFESEALHALPLLSLGRRGSAPRGEWNRV